MAQDSDNPIVLIDTSMGTITAELWADRAPETVKNMLAYIEDEPHDGLILQAEDTEQKLGSQEERAADDR